MTGKPVPGLAIRAASAGDFEALVELDLASARHHAALDPGLYHVPDRELVAVFLRRRLADPDRRVLVAEVEGKVVGMVDVTMAGAPDPGSILRPLPTADLGISVAEPWRGRGIGDALMVAAEEDARERGAERIVLDMHAANAGARRFYERRGYELYGLLMRRALRPEQGTEP